MRSRNLTKTICFLLILLILFLVVQRGLLPYSWMDTNQAKTFYKISDNSTDVVAIGTSLMLMSFSPLRMYDKTGVSSYNRASSVQYPRVAYFVVKETLKTQKPKVIICSAMSLFNNRDVDRQEPWIRRSMDYKKLSIDKIKAAVEIDKDSETQSALSYVLTLLRYHSRWDEFFATGLNSKFGNYDYSRGHVKNYNHRTEEEIANMERHDKADPYIDEKCKESYRKIVKLCRDNGVKFLFVGNIHQKWNDKFHKVTAEFAKETGADFIDYNSPEMMKACGLEWEYDFADWKHTNVRGAIKFTDHLSAYLVEKYHLKESALTTEDRLQYKKDIEKFYMKCSKGLNDGTPIYW